MSRNLTRAAVLVVLVWSVFAVGMRTVPAVHAAPGVAAGGNVIGASLGGGSGVGTLHRVTTTTTHATPLSAADCAAVKHTFPAQANTPHACDIITTSTNTATWWGATPTMASSGPDLVCGAGCTTGCIPANPPLTNDHTYYVYGPVLSYNIVNHLVTSGDTCHTPTVTQHDCYFDYELPPTSITVAGCISYANSDFSVTGRAQYTVNGPFLGYTEWQWTTDPVTVIAGCCTDTASPQH